MSSRAAISGGGAPGSSSRTTARIAGASAAGLTPARATTTDANPQPPINGAKACGPGSRAAPSTRASPTMPTTCIAPTVTVQTAMVVDFAEGGGWALAGAGDGSEPQSVNS